MHSTRNVGCESSVEVTHGTTHPKLPCTRSHPALARPTSLTTSLHLPIGPTPPTASHLLSCPTSLYLHSHLQCHVGASIQRCLPRRPSTPASFHVFSPPTSLPHPPGRCDRPTCPTTTQIGHTHRIDSTRSRRLARSGGTSRAPSSHRQGCGGVACHHNHVGGCLGPLRIGPTAAQCGVETLGVKGNHGRLWRLREAHSPGIAG